MAIDAEQTASQSDAEYQAYLKNRADEKAKAEAEAKADKPGDMTDADFAAFQEWKASRDAAEAEVKPREYYVHLADGNVVTLSEEDSDATGTHYDGIAVIGRYEVGA
jgi:hypothetical protein